MEIDIFEFSNALQEIIFKENKSLLNIYEYKIYYFRSRQNSLENSFLDKKISKKIEEIISLSKF